MVELRFHGRYGQPVTPWAMAVARKALEEGRYVQVFENFGAFRPGAPMYTTVRVSESFIYTRSSNHTTPDIVVVLDNSLFGVTDVTRGLKPGGMVMAAGLQPEGLPVKDFRFISVEVSPGAGREVSKTALLEALADLGVIKKN